MCYEMGGLICLQAGVLFDMMQLYLLSAKHESQCVFQVLAFGWVFLDGSSMAEFAEGVEIQHS
jgi:hypothetical protein